MVTVNPVTAALAIGALVAVVSTVPYMLTAIEYRRRDNGLAYLLLVTGVGIWNLMFAAQLLSTEPIIAGFFLGLSVVGAVQSALGFFLFATTASSTSSALDRPSIYGVVGVLGGLDIVLAVTTPVHPFYWEVVDMTPGGFAVIDPAIGYWLHTGLLVALFGSGALLFAEAAQRRPVDQFPRFYAVGGILTAVAIVGSNFLAPGGLGVAPVSALVLTSIGWIQASRGNPLAWLGVEG